MTRRHWAVLTTTSVLLALAGCVGTTENRGGNLIGLIQMNARSKGTGYTTSPTANFYLAGAATLSSAGSAPDTCSRGSYDPISAPVNEATVLSGGATVAVTVSGITDTLRRSGSVDGTYRTALAAGIAFKPGDTVSFTVAGDGAGFPAVSAIMKTSEPFTMSTIALPAANQTIDVTWTPAATGAAMLLQLLYNDGSNSTPSVPNRQLFCSLVDDGAYSIPAILVDSWRLGSAAARSVVARRLRTLVKQPSGSTALLNVISLFELPPPVSP